MTALAVGLRVCVGFGLFSEIMRHKKIHNSIYFFKYKDISGLLNCEMAVVNSLS